MGSVLLSLLLHTVKTLQYNGKLLSNPINSTTFSIQHPKSPLWIGVFRHRRYPSIFILAYLPREKCGRCLFKNIYFLCWATFHLNAFEIWHLRNIHTKVCYCPGSIVLLNLFWKQMLLCAHSGNSVMKCRGVLLKIIFKGFNSVFIRLTVCCSRFLPRSKFPMVLAVDVQRREIWYNCRSSLYNFTQHRLQYSKCFLFLSSKELQKTLCTVTDFVIFPLLLYFAMNHF